MLPPVVLEGLKNTEDRDCLLARRFLLLLFWVCLVGFFGKNLGVSFGKAIVE